MDVKLSMEQQDFFDTFGFLKFPGVMRDDIGSIAGEFERVFPGHEWAGEHDGTKRTCIVPFIDQREPLSALLDDPRVNGILVSLLGDDYNYMGSDGNYYVGDTAWHRDGAHEKYLFLKIAFYLDPVDGSSGALRVIPGSHRLDDRFGRDLGRKTPRSESFWGVGGRDVPAVALDVTPGDLVVFNHNLFHSSWGGSNRRRMFTINACQRHAAEDVEPLRGYIAGHARFWIDSMYGDAMMRTATPERRKHLEQVLANEGHLAALSVEARRREADRARH